MADERRCRRIAELIQREIGGLLLKHPKKLFFLKITLTAVTVSPDFSVAKVLFSVFDDVNPEEATKMLQNEANFLRKELARTINLRSTPRLIFIYDESIKRGQKLTALIDAAIAADEEQCHE